MYLWILLLNVLAVNLGNRFNSHIHLVILRLLSLLLLYILMFGALLLLFPKVVTSIMSFSLMIILAILGFIS